MMPRLIAYWEAGVMEPTMRSLFDALESGTSPMLHLTKPLRARTVRRTLHPVVQTLRQARYDQRMTVALLAEITGYSAKAIHQWEEGTTNPKLWHLHDWAQALGMAVKIEVRDEQ